MDITLKSQHLWFSDIVQRVSHEVWLTWQFVGGDASSTILPGTLFALAAWHYQGAALESLPLILGMSIFYFWLYILPFDLSNQLVGIEEDKLNKPYRPLVQGLLSYHAAQVRWIAYMALFSMVGYWFHVSEWTVVWQVALTLHNFGGWSRHWLGKNLVMGIGVVAQLAAAWQMVMPLTEQSCRWILALAALIMLLISLQDLRDVEGDLAVGRKTLPIAIGLTQTRYLLGIGFIVLPFVLFWALNLPIRIYPLLWFSALGGVSWWIAFRTLCLRSPEADHQSYLLFTYWYCATLVSAFFLI